jgi:filamentous hemagglutinin
MIGGMSLESRNGLDMAVLGIFGSPGKWTAIFGGSPEQVAAANQFGASIYDVMGAVEVLGPRSTRTGKGSSVDEPATTNREKVTDYLGSGSFWSSTSSKSSVENAYSHWNKHGSEFPEYKNSLQYVKGAQDFVANPPTGTLAINRSNGDVVLYNPVTDIFAVKSADGTPKTMFVPDPAKHGYKTNLEYFYGQKK